MYWLRKFNCLFRIPIAPCHYYAKDVRFGAEVRNLLLQGVNILADAVAITMGPKGRTVILEQPFGPPKITKDGVTVAKGIELQDKFQNIGAKLVQKVANKTNDEAGDGTTTATILARAIAKAGFENMTKGANPIEIRKGVMLAVDTVQEKLKAMSIRIETMEDIEKVATMSANGDSVIGKLISTAMKNVGTDGVVTIKTGRKFEDDIEVIRGLKFDRGYISAFFINSMTGPKVEYTDALVLYSQKKILRSQEICPALEVALSAKKPLIIIADDYDSEILQLLLLNKLKAGLQVVAVKAPPGLADFKKEVLTDMATATGGVVFGDELNLIRLEDCTLESLGKVGEVLITKDSTLLMKGQGDKKEIAQRVDELKKELKKICSEVDRCKLIERLARLNSSIAVLLIGGYSELEANERKDRIHDALNATRAAIAEGVVPGGGTALLRCIPDLDLLQPENTDQAAGINMVKQALRMPCATIANNSGYDGSVVVSTVERLSGNLGYDARIHQIVDMQERGIMDPTKVVRRALVDACGVASLLTTAEAVICEMGEKENPNALGKKHKHMLT